MVRLFTMAFSLSGSSVLSIQVRERKQAGACVASRSGRGTMRRSSCDYIQGAETVWERDPVEKLAHDGQIMGFKYYGFSSCPDTLKEKSSLEELWQSGKAPCKIW